MLSESCLRELREAASTRQIYLGRVRWSKHTDDSIDVYLYYDDELILVLKEVKYGFKMEVEESEPDFMELLNDVLIDAVGGVAGELCIDD